MDFKFNMRSLFNDKKGQAVSLGTVGNFLIGLLVLGLIAVAIFAGGSNIKTSNLFANDPTAQNDTDNTFNNITSATTSFFSNAGTLTTILFVVLLMGLLGLMVFVVRRFGGGAGGL